MRIIKTGLGLALLGAYLCDHARAIATEYAINAAASNITDMRSWRVITLHMSGVANTADGNLTMQILRPITWVDAVDARVGARIEFVLEEMDIEGPATVTAIAPCTRIAPGQGHVVTATFKSQCAAMTNMTLTNGETIKATPRHPLYVASQDRWRAAGDIRPGDEVRSARNNRLLVSSTHITHGATDVFNLEVMADPTYYVTQSEVLVHNSYGQDKLEEAIGYTLGDNLGNGRQGAVYALVDDPNRAVKIWDVSENTADEPVEFAINAALINVIHPGGAVRVHQVVDGLEEVVLPVSVVSNGGVYVSNAAGTARIFGGGSVATIVDRVSPISPVSLGVYREETDVLLGSIRTLGDDVIPKTTMMRLLHARNGDPNATSHNILYGITFDNDTPRPIVVDLR